MFQTKPLFIEIMFLLIPVRYIFYNIINVLTVSFDQFYVVIAE